MKKEKERAFFYVKPKELTMDEMGEIFRNHRIGLYDICRWWIYAYPKDIFSHGPDDIVRIRECMENLLKAKEER